MEKTVLTDLTYDTVLLMLLDSKIPQSVIISRFSFPNLIQLLIVDSAVRNKMTGERFIQLNLVNHYVN